MNGKIVFPKQSKGNNILKIYGIIKNNTLDMPLSKDKVYFDSVDSAIDDYTSSGEDVNRQILVEISIPENTNLDLSSRNVAKMFRNLYNVIIEEYGGFNTDNIDNEILQMYINTYAIDTTSVSRVIMGNERPYRGSKLRINTQTIYSITDLHCVIDMKFYNIVIQNDLSGNRTLIIPR